MAQFSGPTCTCCSGFPSFRSVRGGWTRRGSCKFRSWSTASISLCAAIAYFILQRAVMRAEGADGALARAVGRDWKGKLSPVIYVVGVVAAVLLSPLVALALYTVVALIWLVPDRRMERYLEQRRQSPSSQTSE